VLKEHAIFVASMRLVVEDDTIPNRIRGMFLRDGDTMVVPFCRALKVPKNQGKKCKTNKNLNKQIKPI